MTLGQLASGHSADSCCCTDADAVLVSNSGAGGSLIVELSCDDAMGFTWATSTTFDEPMYTVAANETISRAIEIHDGEADLPPPDPAQPRTS